MALEMSGSYDIPASRQKVWAALNDADVLKAAIPGCEALEKVSDTELKAVVVAKVGPVKAKFKGTVMLSDMAPPESYRISGEGEGGIAGFAKGGASVRLTETESGTKLDYTADAQIGGKLAQLGQRLVAGTAKKLADEFFKNFADAVGEEAAAGE